MTKQLPGANRPAPRREPLSWIPAFLAELTKSGVIRRAVRTAGIVSRTAYEARDRHADFADAWDQALITARANGIAVRAILAPKPPESVTELPSKGLAKATSVYWRPGFFEALAETSSITISAARARVTVATIYKLRREDAEFADNWQAALHEGYDTLEMELLGHLRNPQPGRKMDVTAALRLLAAHRETVERRRALTAEEDEQAVLDSIDQFIEDMRQRRAANTQILLETQASDDAA